MHKLWWRWLRSVLAAGGGDHVFCPYCKHAESRVIDSRTADDGAAIRRRRSCPACGRRFTTQETVILMVAKRSGATEPFAREKIVGGAGRGRPPTTQEAAIWGVPKRGGAREPFAREKIVGGVRRACQGRPVTEDQL